MAPRKVRLVSDLIRKMPVLEAEAQLMSSSKRAAGPILKLLKSGIDAAAKNLNLTPENLYVANIYVDEGETLKRFRPRAFGRAGAIHKKTSHITIVLESSVTPPKRKKAAKKIIKEIKSEKPSFAKAADGKEKIEMAAPKEIKPKQRFKDITRRVFRRKAIG